MDRKHYINEKTHHIDELSMRPSEMDLVAILHNSDIFVPILVRFTILSNYDFGYIALNECSTVVLYVEGWMNWVGFPGGVMY